MTNPTGGAEAGRGGVDFQSPPCELLPRCAVFDRDQRQTRVPGKLRDVMGRNVIRQWKMDPPHASQISLGGRLRRAGRPISVMDSEVG